MQARTLLEQMHPIDVIEEGKNRTRKIERGKARFIWRYFRGKWLGYFRKLLWIYKGLITSRIDTWTKVLINMDRKISTWKRHGGHRWLAMPRLVETHYIRVNVNTCKFFNIGFYSYYNGVKKSTQYKTYILNISTIYILWFVHYIYNTYVSYQSTTNKEKVNQYSLHNVTILLVQFSANLIFYKILHSGFSCHLFYFMV